MRFQSCVQKTHPILFCLKSFLPPVKHSFEFLSVWRGTTCWSCVLVCTLQYSSFHVTFIFLLNHVAPSDRAKGNKIKSNRQTITSEGKDLFFLSVYTTLNVRQAGSEWEPWDLQRMLLTKPVFTPCPKRHATACLSSYVTTYCLGFCLWPNMDFINLLMEVASSLVSP